MSAVARKREHRPPTFHWSEYVDVDFEVDPEDLEAAGWVYVGKGGKGVSAQNRWHAAITRNHETEHDGPLRWCQHPLCAEVNADENEAAGGAA